MRYVAGAPGPPFGPYDADVVILALDRPEETVAAIRSALAQTAVTRHVTVLDQGSRAENLDCLALAVTGRNDATVLSAGYNLGVAEGRNRATSIGHGRVIAALDNDAEFATADTLSRMVAALDGAPDLAAIGCRIVRFDSGEDDLSSWGYPIALLPRATESFPSVTFVGAGHAIRRSAWDDAGGYDAKLFFCWEEFDFCLRAICRGWGIAYRGDLVIRHKVSGEQRVAWSHARWFQYVRNRLYIGRKTGAHWLQLTPRILCYFIKGARHGLTPQTVSAVRAAARLAEGTPKYNLPAAARNYLRQNDTIHRGSWHNRLRAELLAKIV